MMTMMMMTMMMMTIDNDDNSNNNDEKCNYQANPSGVVYLSMRFLIKMFKQDFSKNKDFLKYSDSRRTAEQLSTAVI